MSFRDFSFSLSWIVLKLKRFWEKAEEYPLDDDDNKNQHEPSSWIIDYR